jgi:hypothetical protein
MRILKRSAPKNVLFSAPINLTFLPFSCILLKVLKEKITFGLSLNHATFTDHKWKDIPTEVVRAGRHHLEHDLH